MKVVRFLLLLCLTFSITTLCENKSPSSSKKTTIKKKNMTKKRTKKTSKKTYGPFAKSSTIKPIPTRPLQPHPFPSTEESTKALDSWDSREFSQLP